MSISLFSFLFIGEIICIYFISRLALQKTYLYLRRFIKKDSLIIFLVALVYFPGTLIHELSHYIVALILNMHPSEVRLIPVIEGRNVKLGHVLYEKHPHDFIRPVLIGIAPLFGGLAVLWLIIQANLFPGRELWQTLLFGYLILSISANMFSSKQDLIDVIYLVPIALLIGFLWYLFPFQIAPAAINQLTPPLLHFLKTLQSPLLFSIGIHALLVMLLSVKT